MTGEAMGAGSVWRPRFPLPLGTDGLPTRRLFANVAYDAPRLDAASGRRLGRRARGPVRRREVVGMTTTTPAELRLALEDLLEAADGVAAAEARLKRSRQDGVGARTYRTRFRRGCTTPREPRSGTRSKMRAASAALTSSASMSASRSTMRSRCSTSRSSRTRRLALRDVSRQASSRRRPMPSSWGGSERARYVVLGRSTTAPRSRESPGCGAFSYSDLRVARAPQDSVGSGRQWSSLPRAIPWSRQSLPRSG